MASEVKQVSHKADVKIQTLLKEGRLTESSLKAGLQKNEINLEGSL